MRLALRGMHQAGTAAAEPGAHLERRVDEVSKGLLPAVQLPHEQPKGVHVGGPAEGLAAEDLGGEVGRGLGAGPPDHLAHHQLQAGRQAAGQLSGLLDEGSRAGGQVLGQPWQGCAM